MEQFEAVLTVSVAVWVAFAARVTGVMERQYGKVDDVALVSAARKGQRSGESVGDEVIVSAPELCRRRSSA